MKVWENLHNYIMKYLEVEKWFIIQNFFWVESSTPRTYWCWGMKITLLRKGFFSQGQDDEQFRLEATRSTAWLSSDHEGKSSLCHLPLLFHIFFEQNNTWLRHKRRLSSTNCNNGSSKCHFWITYHLRTISYLIGTRVIIRPDICFFTRILTIELQWDGSWCKTGHMGSNCHWPLRMWTPVMVFVQSKASSQGVTSQHSFWSLTTTSSIIMGRISEEMSPLSEVSSEIRQSHWVIWRTSGRS
jgi:hypothetical protein